jgi:hypothetical protein
MKNIYLEDNGNIYISRFKITFKNDDDDDVDFPDDDDIEHIIENSGGLIDEANDYVSYLKKQTSKKSVFVVEVSNEETDEYMPSEDDLESLMEFSGIIDDSLYFFVEQTHRTISKAEAREEKLNLIL